MTSYLIVANYATEAGAAVYREVREVDADSPTEAVEIAVDEAGHVLWETNKTIHAIPVSAISPGFAVSKQTIPERVSFQVKRV
jgi:hypothetical protein